MSKKPDILDRERVARSRLFEVEAVSLRFANGNERVFERLVSRGFGAVMVAAVADNRVYLVREYGAGEHDYHLSLPKGAVNPGESLTAAANRELQEEVGLAAGRLQVLKRITLTPNYMEHDIHLVLAEDLYPSRLPGDEPEPLEVVPWSLDDLPALMAREDVTEGRAIAGLYLVRDLLRERDANIPCAEPKA